MPRKVLVIEDEAVIQNLIKRVLHRLGLDTLPAMTIEQACRLFQLHQEEILMIVVDGSLEQSGKLDTGILVRKMRESFDRPMIAISACEKFNQTLMRLGCSHYGQKPDIIDSILDAVRDCKNLLHN